MLCHKDGYYNNKWHHALFECNLNFQKILSDFIQLYKQERSIWGIIFVQNQVGQCDHSQYNVSCFLCFSCRIFARKRGNYFYVEKGGLKIYKQNHNLFLNLSQYLVRGPTFKLTYILSYFVIFIIRVLKYNVGMLYNRYLITEKHRLVNVERV